MAGSKWGYRIQTGYVIQKLNITSCHSVEQTTAMIIRSKSWSSLPSWCWRRCNSLCHPSRSFATLSSSSVPETVISKADELHTIRMVRLHDAAGYLPGQLLPNHRMRETYFGVRSFWVETGLRFGSTALVPSHSPPEVHLEWWERGIQVLYQDMDTMEGNTTEHEPHNYNQHPTWRLLKQLIQRHDLSKSYFDDILLGRRKDLDTKQYETLQELIDHASLSCGSLFSLVLESASLTASNHPPAHAAAQLLGKAHGLTNALRFSIPLVSSTGKLILPKDLCLKHGVSSPRYLLSALGQGDASCQQALRLVVQDICTEARRDLQLARDMRVAILDHDKAASPKAGKHAVAVFLPAVASETFLNRLESKHYDLTDKNLRHTGLFDRFAGIASMVTAFYQDRY